MPHLIKRLTLGANSRIEVTNCGGHLEVRGTSRPEVTIEAHHPSSTIEEREGGVVINSPSHCTIRVPAGSPVIISHVGGNLRLKDLTEPVEIGQVDGQCSMRRVGTITINMVASELRGNDVHGSLTAGEISGHATLKDVEGPVHIDLIEGHFYGSNIPNGILLDRVEGNLSLRTDFSPGTMNHFMVDGQASFSIPESANVRFQIRAEGKVRVEQGMLTEAEGRVRVVTLGSGEATVEVAADGHVSIKYWDYYAGDDSPFVFVDFSSGLDDDFEQLESRFRAFETSLDHLPDHIRGRVARKLDHARQRMEEAQRRVEKTVRSVSRDVGAAAMGGSVQVEFDGGVEPVTEDERLMILKMLEEGKITVAEAEKLLAALEGRG